MPAELQRTVPWNWMKKFMATSTAYKCIQDLTEKLKAFQIHMRENCVKVKQRVCARNYYNKLSFKVGDLGNVKKITGQRC